jgi:hypothetical protein
VRILPVTFHPVTSEASGHILIEAAVTARS